MSTHGIVVGYDGSAEADEATAWAVDAARARGEQMAVVIVADRMESPRSPSPPEEWWAEIEETARRTLAAAGAADHTIERQVGRGLVSPLLDASREASMLVLGSHGHSRVGEFFHGSVSQSAARRAHTPVVVVRRAHAADTSRIVVGFDGSESSVRAVDFACEHAAATGQHVVLVRAQRQPQTIPVDEHGDIPASISATLLDDEEGMNAGVAEARARHPEVAVEGELIAIAAGRALEDASSTAGLLVVGSRGRGAVAETVLGSVSHHLLRRAHCPVAVVH
ncbi:MAG TPA: universal stress protein [Nocardioides sp.]|jgi:nucleotide-binding universal stress UspA family protein|nr:universal stress protein [Nocardioides sp.]